MAEPPRVLIVEDNDMNYEVASYILGRMGITVSRVMDGNDVLPSVLASPPDLIYMDIQLPGTDGLDATRHLRADERTRLIPIVALTAMSLMGDYARALAAGCDSYIVKPISVSELRASALRFIPTLVDASGPEPDSEERPVTPW